LLEAHNFVYDLFIDVVSTTVRQDDSNFDTPMEEINPGFKKKIKMIWKGMIKNISVPHILCGHTCS